MVDVPVGRRAFLARAGVLGAVLATGGPATEAAAAVRRSLRGGSPGGVDLDALRQVLAELARDTVNGLAVFVLPGPDAYSTAQGVTDPAPGALEAKTTDFLIASLDGFVPAPDIVIAPLNSALAAALSATPVPLPADPRSSGDVATLDAAVRELLENDETLPTSGTVALLLNLLATRVNPAAVNGAFLSPFARLSFAEKATAFELLEGADADLVASLDAGLPEPFTASVSGLMKFVAGALLEFCAYGSYTEWAVFDPDERRLTARPVGWALTGYQPDGPVEGWDELLGYYPGTLKG